MDHRDVIEKLAAAGHLNDQQISRIGRNVAELMDAVDAQPSIVKEAATIAGAANPGFWGKLWSGMKSVGSDTGNVLLKQVLPYSAAAAAAGTAFGYSQKAMGAVGEATIGKVQKARAFDKMLDVHPDLKDRDANKVKLHFNSLHHFSPEYAKDPLMAGEYVKQTMDTAAIPLVTPKTLVDVQKGLKGTPQQQARLESFITQGQSVADIAADQARRAESHEWMKADQPRKERQMQLSELQSARAGRQMQIQESKDIRDQKRERRDEESHKWHAQQQDWAVEDRPYSEVRSEMAQRQGLLELGNKLETALNVQSRLENRLHEMTKPTSGATKESIERARKNLRYANKAVEYLRGTKATLPS